MSTFFLDFENGNDANDGTTFANRWKTFANGATAARTAPGDTIKIMGTPDPTLVDSSASWTQDSKTVTLSASVTQMIADCESVWTSDGGANVVVTTSTAQFKEGTKSANIAIGAAFTTGLAAHFATGTLDLSTYQQVSFWIRNSIAVAASTLSLHLCSDTAGTTIVNTIVVPAIPSTAIWTMITVDTAGALGSSIKSISLFCDLDPGTLTVNLDNIIACKASSSADALTLQSLIGKKWNQVWVASATFASNDIVKPTQPNRNGFRYKVTAGGGGAAGSSEPQWPTEIGVTVVDGALTWTCDSLEDTWYPIQSINGVTVKIDNDCNVLGSAGNGYSGTTESVATYKRECINVLNAAAGTFWQLVQESGTDGNHITYSGGWDRTNMTTQNLETWVQGANGRGIFFSVNSKDFITFTNLNVGRSGTSSFNINASNTNVTMNNCHGRLLIVDSIYFKLTGGNFSNDTPGGASGANGGISLSAVTNNVDLKRVSANSQIGRGISGAWGFPVRGEYLYVARNSTGILVGQPNCFLSNCVTRGNTIGIDASPYGVRMFNCLFPDGITVGSAATNIYAYSQNDQQVAGVHKITTGNGYIASDASTRHTASGISWNFHFDLPRTSEQPMLLSVAKLACLANVLVTLSIWTRRDTTASSGSLVVRGGQIAGVPNDVSVTSTPSINTWVQSTNLTFTPTENGVVEVQFWGSSTGTNVNYWVDDSAVA
jgi:hypothetical protein